MVEDGETPGQACVRELYEETGVIGYVMEPIYDGPHDGDETVARGSHVHVFAVLRRDGMPSEREPGSPVRWLTREELMRWTPFKGFYRRMFAAIDDTTPPATEDSGGGR